ncbi:MAG: twin-arginine translocase TatA/TatE family subunit [Candidatus Nanopelagicaceae bacterium]|jgi:sec-independent protein translocase protein TatA|nr:twin-arginine translocase TatA/TatE family subunit [Candidatus Nanopelagicaceae bacterium]NDF02123.1 twin-arginine translocase TatA/TatE family subunit [Actinomycetota bacterium]
MFLREPSHILILVIVLVLLFGAKRLPDSARALGKSMKIFKNEVKELNADKPKEDDSDGDKKNSGA